MLTARMPANKMKNHNRRAKGKQISIAVLPPMMMASNMIKGSVNRATQASDSWPSNDQVTTASARIHSITETATPSHASNPGQETTGNHNNWCMIRANATMTAVSGTNAANM
jgi:hypothetical protein